MTVQVSSAARTRQFLRNLLNNGGVASRYDQYVKENILHSPYSGDTFYMKTLAEKGKDAAEEQLSKWNTDQRMSDYAALVEPVVRGMLALSKIDNTLEGENVKLLRILRENASSSVPYGFKDGYVAILTNFDAPGCGCTRLEDSHLFSPYGLLGIKAVVLAHDNTRNVTELGVVLPYRHLESLDDGLRQSSFTIATITTEGRKDADTFIPDKVDPDLLAKLLGLSDEPLPRVLRTSGGHFDEAVGFPGATDYLANQLPKLEKYFMALAASLSSSHAH